MKVPVRGRGARQDNSKTVNNSGSNLYAKPMPVRRNRERLRGRAVWDA